MSGMIELSVHTKNLLDGRMEPHDAALELRRQRRYGEADEAFAAAAAESMSRPVRAWEIIDGGDDGIVHISREVAYGRIMLDWAATTEEAARLEADHERRQAAFDLALARAARGCVLLDQDQHCIVTAEEQYAAHAAVESLREIAEGIAQPIRLVA